jgi:hypothetical protein
LSTWESSSLGFLNSMARKMGWRHLGITSSRSYASQATLAIPIAPRPPFMDGGYGDWGKRVG